VRRRWLIAGVAVLALGAAAGAWSALRQRAPAAPEGAALERLGDYGRVPPFRLIERSGRPVTREDLRGLVWVVDFFYTACTETCPTQSLELARLAREFADASDLRLVSISVDPAHDTPEVLRRYAARYGADARWWFLTGERRAIYCLAREGFRLAVTDPAQPAPPDCAAAWGPPRAWAAHGSGGLVMHSARVALVDRRARIRAYHLATDPASMVALRANLRAVLAE